jgi:hypothetical protein
MQPLVRSLFRQGLEELDTPEDFEEVRPVFEFQRKRVAENPERRVTALEIFPFRGVPAPVKFVILAAREATQLEALERLWQEACLERMEGVKTRPPDNASRPAAEARGDADSQEMGLFEALSRKAESLKTLKQCAAAARLVEMHCEALSRGDPAVGTEVETEVLELATGLPVDIVRLFASFRTPGAIQGFVNLVARRDAAIREEMKKDVWVSIHPDNFNYQVPEHTGT